MPPEPKSLRSNTPDWLNFIIMKCIQKNPVDRYRTAMEIRNDIPEGT